MMRLGLQVSQGDRPAERVLRRLSSLGSLSADAKALVSSLDEARTWEAGGELVSEQERLHRPMFLVSGWAARIRILPDGRRQIINFVLPGDALGLCLRPKQRNLCATVALTAVETLAAGASQKALSAGAGFSEALSEIAQIAASLDEVWLVDQVMRLGCCSAYERMCHLFLEMWHRLQAVGLAEANRIPMPLTQDVLADAAGVSNVHVNRVLQQLRGEKLIELRHGWLTILEPEVISSIADYREPW